MKVRFDFNFDDEHVTFNGHFVKATTQAIQGQIFERAYLGSGVAVLPINRKEKKLLLINEFRVHYGHAGEESLKLVTGWMEDHHASYLDAAKEELAEEVGARSDNWDMFYSAHHRATVSSHKEYFVAYDPVFDVQQENTDIDTILETRWVTEEEIWSLLETQELKWTRDMLVALLALRSL